MRTRGETPSSCSNPTTPFKLGRIPHETSSCFTLSQAIFTPDREWKRMPTPTHYYLHMRAFAVPEAVPRAEVVAGARTVVIGVTKADAFATRHASAIAQAAMICLKAMLSVRLALLRSCSPCLCSCCQVLSGGYSNENPAYLEIFVRGTLGAVARNPTFSLCTRRRHPPTYTLQPCR